MKPRSVIEVIREAATLRHVTRSYAAMHDRFSELEQMYAGSGAVYEAEGAHDYALMTLKAYRAELDDPEPPTLGLA